MRRVFNTFFVLNKPGLITKYVTFWRVGTKTRADGSQVTSTKVLCGSRTTKWFLWIQIAHGRSVLEDRGVFWVLWCETGRVFGFVILLIRGEDMWHILFQGNIYVDKCIYGNDMALVYIKTATYRQERSRTGLWRSRFPRTAGSAVIFLRSVCFFKALPVRWK